MTPKPLRQSLVTFPCGVNANQTLGSAGESLGCLVAWKIRQFKCYRLRISGSDLFVFPQEAGSLFWYVRLAGYPVLLWFGSASFPGTPWPPRPLVGDARPPVPLARGRPCAAPRLTRMAVQGALGGRGWGPPSPPSLQHVAWRLGQ